MPQRNPQANCKTCPYYNEYVDKTDVIYRECRRKPPVYNAEYVANWPKIGSYNDWCGEHPDFLAETGAMQK